MKNLKLQFIYGLGQIKALDAATAIFDALNIKSQTVTHGVQKSTRKKILKHIETVRDYAFNIKVEDYYFQFSTITRYQHHLININKPDASLKKNWCLDWVATFNRVAPLSQAQLLDRDYFYWQNLEDPQFYKAQNRAYTHLPMKPNNLYPPNDMLIIDTSNNPGLRAIKMGYIEVVGSQMWLGDHFWSVAPKDKESVIRDLSDVGVKVISQDGLLYINAAPEPFTEESDVEFQKKLRAAIFY